MRSEDICRCRKLTALAEGQTKTVETTQAELQVDNNANLPPLMNPAMLEASEDLTNLSHLNEPAGSSRPKLKILSVHLRLTALKSSKLSSFAMPRKRYIPTVELS